MVKGYKRQVVVLRGTERDSFTEAYFLLKETEQEKSHSDLVTEAKRILADCNCDGERRTGGGRVRNAVGWFFCGMGSTLAVGGMLLAVL